MKNTIYLTVLLYCFQGWAQKKDDLTLKSKDTLNELEVQWLQAVNNDSIFKDTEYIIFQGDTLTIALDEVEIMDKVHFDSFYEKNYYLWFRERVLKVYPYAKLASERLETLNNRLDKIESKRKRKKYVRIIQRYMENEFTDQLKKLTRTEGRILIKLIHRQTGKTTFELIKEMRSGWKAFWYNSTASLFKLSLKDKYQPISDREDFLIEDILQRAFSEGYLENQKPKIPIDYFNISKRVNLDILPADLKKKIKLQEEKVQKTAQN